MLTKRIEKKLDDNYTRMPWAILNKSWRQHPTKQQLYGHQPSVTKTIKVWRTRHTGHCWRSRDEIISDVLLWTPSHGRAKAGWPARTYIQQPCADIGCTPEDLPEAMDGREGWRESVRDIHADGATRWWCWYQSSLCLHRLFSLTLTVNFRPFWEKKLREVYFMMKCYDFIFHRASWLYNSVIYSQLMNIPGKRMVLIKI